MGLSRVVAMVVVVELVPAMEPVGSMEVAMVAVAGAALVVGMELENMLV